MLNQKSDNKCSRINWFPAKALPHGFVRQIIIDEKLPLTIRFHLTSSSSHLPSRREFPCLLIPRLFKPFKSQSRNRIKSVEMEKLPNIIGISGDSLSTCLICGPITSLKPSLHFFRAASLRFNNKRREIINFLSKNAIGNFIFPFTGEHLKRLEQ